MDSYVEAAIKGIIRPPRCKYTTKDLMNLPVDENGDLYVRSNAPVLVSRNDDVDLKINCSVYCADGTDAIGKNCVIYLHGNASSQLEGLFLVPNVCPLDICVACFDFAGCGQSDGDYISLGYYESVDTVALINELVDKYKFKKFVLWGRSMGAATSILVKHELVAGIIVDSAYTSIRDAVTAIATRFEIPRPVIPICLAYLRYKISNRAQFDLDSVSVLDAAKAEGCAPMLMGHARGDEFIPIEQGIEIFKVYNNPNKTFEELPGGHNSRREDDWLKKALKFILTVFEMEDKVEMIKDIKRTALAESEQCHFKSYQEMAANIKE